MPQYVGWIAFFLLFCAFGAVAERAGGSGDDLAAEIERLKQIISEAQQTVAECLERIEALEAKQREKKRPESREEDVTGGKIEFSGDFRYRYETSCSSKSHTRWATTR